MAKGMLVSTARRLLLVFPRNIGVRISSETPVSGATMEATTHD
jgi:hypothetical protein